MFDAGFSEAILALLVALIVLGPERLPVLVRWLAGWIKRWRAFSAAIQREVNAAVPSQALHQTLQSGRAELREAATLREQAGDGLRSLQTEFSAATTLAPTASPPQRYRVTAPSATPPPAASEEA